MNDNAKNMMNQLMTTLRGGNASSSVPVRAMVVLSQTLSYTDLIVYSRVLLHRNVHNLLADLADNIRAVYQEDGTLNCPVYEARMLTLHELLYGMLSLVGHLERVPMAFRQGRFTLTSEFIMEQVANCIISLPELYVGWGMLRFAIGNDEPSWQQELRSRLRIDDEYDRIICSILTDKVDSWTYRIESDREVVFSVDAYYAILRTAIATLRPRLTRRIQLKGLKSPAFQNALDRVMTEKILSRISGLGAVVGKAIDTFLRWQTVNIKSGGICVTPHSEPNLHKIVCKVCAVLDMPVPEVYIYDDVPGINAYTTGVDTPIIVVTRLAVSMLDEHELAYIIGHECGHILCKHVKNHALMNMLMLNVVPGGELVQAVVLGPMLYSWYRRSELSADRAGLLACQNPEAVKRAMLKMMGTPFSEFHRIRTSTLLSQSMDFQDLMEDSTLDRMFNLVQTLTLSHPRLVFRCLELMNWIKSGEYEMLLNANSEERGRLADWGMGDSAEQAMRSAYAFRLADWSVTFTNRPYRELLFEARTLLLSAEKPAEYPFNTVFSVHVEIVANAEQDKLYDTNLVVRHVTPNGPGETSMPVSSSDWGDLPDDVQSHFIRKGNRESYTEELYCFTALTNR